MKRLKYLLIFINSIRFIKNWFFLPFVFIGKYNLIKLKNGLAFHVYDFLNVLQIIEIFKNEDYKSTIKNPKVIIDIGANIGDSSIYYARKFPDSTIYAIEANKKVFRYLIKNITTNNINNVIPYNLAISNKSGYINFYNYEKSGLSSYFNTKNQKFGRAKVKSLTLKKFFQANHILVCDILKLDCEGAEFDIILNFKSETLKQIKSIILEYHDSLTNYNHSLIFKFLKKNGYNVKIRPHNIEKDIGIIYAKK